MFKLLKTMLVMAVMVATFASAAVASELDQTNTNNDGYYTVPLGCSEALAQTFTVGKEGELDKVSLYLGREGTSGSDLLVKIFGVDPATGKPDTSDPWAPENGEQKSGTGINYGSLPWGVNGWFDIQLATAVNVVPGEQYAIVFHRDGPCSNSDGSIRFARSYGDTYLAGGSWHMARGVFAQSWETISTPSDETDIYFKTFVTPPPPPDTDGDGVIDSEDNCPSEVGPASNNGCPLPPPDTTAPTGTIQINNGAAKTDTRLVTLNLTASDPEPSSGGLQMRFKNADVYGSTFSAWEPFATEKEWKLSPRIEESKTKKVVVQYRDAAGNKSMATDYITLTG